MTIKKYYENVNLQQLHTKVVDESKNEQDEYYCILEETIFYPTGGGQPHDTGFINGIEVYRVEEIEGVIYHFIQEPLNALEASCQLDMKRRFDHMQQHAGQHILSATFENYFSLKTISFHLGEETCTIDLDIESVSETILQEVEERTNQLIIENRPIITKWVTKEQAGQLPLRKKLSVENHIRLVIIPDYDYNGCGGTHPEFTGQVMGIKIVATEKMKQKTRVTFICGKRLLADLHTKQQIISELQVVLNASQEKLVDSSKRLLVSEKEKTKEIAQLKEELLNKRVQEILTNEKLIQCIDLGHEPMATLQKIAKKCTTEREELILFVISKSNDTVQFVCAKGKQASSNQNMKELNQLIIDEVNGKGGGNDQFAQGGGTSDLSTDALITIAQSYLQV